MIVQGVDLSSLPAQFGSYTPGRTLILDGDGPCYVVASTVKRMDTAIRRYQQDMLKFMFLTNAEHVRVHLTAHDSLKANRHFVNAVKPYQGQRKGKAKPALLEPLRQAMADRSNWLPEFEVFYHRELEADDGMMHDAYYYKELGVIRSEDKDLRMTPYPYWDIESGRLMQSESVGWLEMKYTPAGNTKCIGQGPVFFWAQMLMGDTADNIQGILRLDGQKCGAVGAYNALAPRVYLGIDNVANFVLDAYREIDQNPISEGFLLWMQRWSGDSVLQYFSELNLSDENRRYIHECYERNWFGNPSAATDA